MMQAKTGRNDPCPCGSGKKFKQCCMQQQSRPATSLGLDSQIQQAMRHAWMLQSMNRNTEAEAICKQIFTVNPNHPDALHLLGVIALRDGNITPAITALSKAVRLDPRNPHYHSNLGLAYHESGRLEEAVEHYRDALMLWAGYADAHYNLHAALLSTAGLDAAIASLQRLLAITAHDLDAQFMLAVLSACRGDRTDAEASATQQNFQSLSETSPLLAARVDAWRYLESVSKKLPQVTGSNIETFRLALSAAKREGLVLEFGVRHGNTIRQIAGLAGQYVYGFDSFEGLPEQWHHEPKGSYTTKGQMPEVPPQVKLHAGWFEDTLPAFLEQYPGDIRMVNIDCDIYSSTKTVLDALAPRIAPGSVLVFDEYIGNEHWREDEFKAFQEAVTKYRWDYEYLSFSFFTKQVTVRIK